MRLPHSPTPAPTGRVSQDPTVAGTEWAMLTVVTPSLSPLCLTLPWSSTV